MKKNLLTIVILALSLMNMVLTAVIVFTVVPTSMRTNKLIAKVASNIDLEIDSPLEKPDEVAIQDIETFQIPDDITISLKKSPNDSKAHYALVSVSFSVNTKSKDYETLNPMIASNIDPLKEIISDEFSKYTVDDVTDNKEKIKEEILKRVQEKFQSDFIISVSVGKLVVE